jgi:AAA domain
VLVVDEISQIGPRPMLRLLELQAETGMTIKMLADREQVQSIEAGDTIALLKRVLPKTPSPRC